MRVRLNIRVPQQSDKLFVDGGPPLAQGTIWAGELSFAATGFKSAADGMVETLLAGHTNNFWVFPIAFCYRQYLELMLKSIIEIYHACEGTGETFPHTHNLKTLWEFVKGHCYGTVEPEDQDEVNVVETLMLEFHDFDAKSTAFRYAERVPLAQFDLRNLADVMEGLETHLEALESMWDDYHRSIS